MARPLSVASKEIRNVVRTYHAGYRMKGEAEDTFDEISSKCSYFKTYEDKFDGEEIHSCRHFHHPHKGKSITSECEARHCPLYPWSEFVKELSS